MFAMVCLIPLQIRADDTSYSYDAQGRVVGASSSTTGGTRYSYDAVGNLQNVQSLPAGQVAIFSFMPSHGTAGTRVVIEGQGFDPSSAADQVNFNGVAAQVVTASDHELSVVVPAGAVTGPITVATGSGSATSAQAFQVDNAGMPPVITGISPALVNVGDTTTLTGQHLSPAPGATAAILGGAALTVASASDTSLQLTVPAGVSSGHVQIKTPYGTTTSSVPLIVLPDALRASDVTSASWVQTDGSQATLTANAAGKSAGLMFEGSVGDWLSVQLSQVTTAAFSVHYVVYGPGNRVLQQGYVSASDPSIHLPQLPASGSYLITFTPDTASAQFTVDVEHDTSVVAESVIAQQTTFAWQSKRLLFKASAGQDLELTINGINIPGNSGNLATFYVFNSAGVQVASFSCLSYNPSASCIQHLWDLADDTYSITTVPNAAGPLGFNLILRADLVSDLDGAVDLNLAAGQVQRFSFQAREGQTLVFNATATTTPSVSGVGATVTIYRPDAGVINASTPIYASFRTSSITAINLPNLPVSGQYTAIIVPDDGLPAAIHAAVLPGVTSTLSINGPAVALASSVPAQSIYTAFSATQGENVELTLSNMTSSAPSWGAFDVVVTSSAGVVADRYTCYTYYPGNSCMHHFWNLVADTYTAVITPEQGTANFSATVNDDVMGPSLSAGTPFDLSLGAGQVERFTFTAKSGDTLALNLGALQTTAGQGVTLAVYRPDSGAIYGGTTAYASKDTSSSSTLNLANLPVSGQYTVVVSPDNGLAIHATLGLLAGQVGDLQSEAAPAHFANAFALQNTYLNFTAVDGEDLELTLQNLSSTGSGPLLVQLVNAQSQVIGNSQTCYVNQADSCIVSLWHMAAGSYQVIVSAPYDSNALYGFDALLRKDVVVGALSAAQPVTLNFGAGQVERFTLNAQAGDTVALQLQGISTHPSLPNEGITFYIYRPDMGDISTGTSVYATVHALGSQTINLPNLPVTGTWRVIAVPDNGLAATVQVQWLNGATGSIGATSDAQGYATVASGQNVYLGFTASQGANLELSLTGLKMQNASDAGVNIMIVNNASGVVVASTTACWSSNPQGSCIIPLWDLQAGDYTIAITPYDGSNGGSMQFNARLQPDLAGPDLALTQVRNLQLGDGQAARLTFTATAGDNVTLELNEALTSQGNVVKFALYQPNGGAITTSTTVYGSFSVSSSGTQDVTFSNLPVSGTYTLIATPQYGLATSLSVWKKSEVVGTVPTFVTPSLSASAPAQAEAGVNAGDSVTMVFNTQWDDNLELTLSNIDVPDGSVNGFQVDIYDPNGKDIRSYDCYASNPASSCRTSLWDMAAGSFKVVVSAPWGGHIHFNAQLLPDVAGGALNVGSPATVNLAEGQIERFTFQGKAGDNVALALSHVSTTPGGQPVSISVYRPDVRPIWTAYQSTSTTGSTTLNLPDLPVDGTYIVAVYTAYGEPAQASLVLQSDSAGALTKDAPALHVATGSLSQNAYLTFHANGGDNLELTLANLLGADGSWLSASVQVIGPNGVQYGWNSCSSSNPGNACRMALSHLAAGDYSVIVTPQSQVVMTFDAFLLSDIPGPSLAFNTPTTVNLGLGQVQRLTFQAHEGDTVALALSGGRTTPGSQYMNVIVYNPGWGSGDTNAYATTYTTSSATLNLPDLPATGTYTVLVYSSFGEPGSVTLNLLPGVVGSIPEGTTPATFTAAPGQNGYLNFTANAGDNLQLLLSNVSGFIEVNVYGLSGNQIGTFFCSGGSSCVAPLWNLSAGTYSVVIDDSGGGGYTFSANLIPNVIGSALARNTLTPVTLPAGTVKRYTFHATAGDSLAFNVSGVTTSPSGQSVYVSVYRPDAGLLTPSNDYAQLVTPSAQTANLWTLPVTGDYTVVVGQSSGLPAQMQLLLSDGQVSTLTKDGSVQTFAAASGDEAYSTSFDAADGDNLELAFDHVAVPNNSFTSGLSLAVYDSRGNALPLFSDCDESASCRFPLWNLSAGHYRVVVTPAFHGNIAFNVRLVTDTIGPDLQPNIVSDVSVPQGSVERLTFTGTQGQGVSLSLGNVIYASNQRVHVNVYRPDGGAIVANASGSIQDSNYYANLASTTGGVLNLPSLPVSGSYRVLIYSDDGIPVSGQLTYNTQQSATITVDGVWQSFTTSGPGHGSDIGFDATAGDNLELNLSNLVDLSQGQGPLLVTIYGPDGSLLTKYNCTPSSITASCLGHLWNLTAGTYHVIATSTDGSTLRFDGKLQRDVIAGTLVQGQPFVLEPSAASVQRLIFNANAGDNLSLMLSHVAMTPAAAGMTLSVYRPDAGAMVVGNAYREWDSHQGNALDLDNLPVSGAYTVIVTHEGGVPGGAVLSLGVH